MKHALHTLAETIAIPLIMAVGMYLAEKADAILDT